MRVRHGLLFLGLFLIPLGGVLLLVRAGVLDADRLTDAWRLWPLVLIGLGISIVLARSRLAVVGTAIVALVLGSLAGAAIAGSDGWIGALSDCGGSSRATDEHLRRDGSFDLGADVRLDLRCGSLALATTGEPGWRLDAAHRGSAPLVDSSASGLDVRVPGGSGERRNDWTVGLPAATVSSIELTANAATAGLDLAGARLTSLAADMNAGDLRVDVAGGTIDQIDLTMNAGRIRLAAGSSALRGDVSLNAGAFDLCVPDGVGLQLDVTDQLTFVHNLASRGLVHLGRTWGRAATNLGQVITLSIEGSAASFTLNPAGGCR
jgi:hypothetical protein